jgi:hypothetical protein
MGINGFLFSITKKNSVQKKWQWLQIAHDRTLMGSLDILCRVATADY